MAKRGHPPGVIMRGSVVRQRREAMGFTREKFCAHAKIAESTLKKAEKNTVVDRASAMRISQGLDLPYLVVVRPDPEHVAMCIARAGCQPPPIANEPWVDRNAEFAHLVKLLSKEDGWIRIRITGLSGVGKTALAVRAVAHQDVQARFKDGIIWLPTAGRIDGGPRASMMSGLAAALNLDRVLADLADSPDRYANALRHHLAQRQVLLIIDELVVPELVAQLVNPVSNCVLVTTHLQSVCSEFAYTIPLEHFKDASARAVLAHYIGEDRLNEDPDGTRALLDALGGVPHDLQLAGKVLARQRLTTLSDYVARRQSEDQSSIESLRDLLPVNGLEFLAKLGVFGSDPFSVRWAAGVAGVPARDAACWLSVLDDVHLTTLVAHDRGAHRHDWAVIMAHPLLAHTQRLHPARRGADALTRAAEQVAASLVDASSEARWACVTRFQALWARVLDRLSEEIEDVYGRSLPAEKVLAHLDAASTSASAASSNLPRLVLALGDALTAVRSGNPLRWLTAACLAAPGAIERGLVTLRIGELHYPEFSAALPWFQWAGRQLAAAGDFAIASVAWTEAGKMHHGLEHFDEGLAALEKAASLTRQADVPSPTLLVRVNNLALAHPMLRSGPAERWTTALEILKDAEAKIDEHNPSQQYIRAIIRINQLMVSAVGGRDLADIEAALHAFDKALPEGSLYPTYAALTLSQLGWAEDPFSWAHERWTVSLDVDPAHVDRPYRHLSCVITNLLTLQRQRQAGEMTLLPGGHRNSVAIIDASHDSPPLIASAGSMALLYLVEPFERLFDRSLSQRAYRFLFAGYGEEHPACLRCREWIDMRWPGLSERERPS